MVGKSLIACYRGRSRQAAPGLTLMQVNTLCGEVEYDD